jgi:FAD/FMN-containing dehydrogenase
MEGSFAAEHGLGRSKLELANHSRSLVERNLMAKLKHALDPRCLMNPGVLVSGAERKE